MIMVRSKKEKEEKILKVWEIEAIFPKIFHVRLKNDPIHLFHKTFAISKPSNLRLV